MKKQWIRISDLLSFQEGPGVRNTQYTTSGVKLLNVANLVDGKVDLSTSERYISEEEAYGKYKHFLCDKGDFVVASSGIKVEYIDKKMGFIDESMLPLCMNTSTIRFKVLDPSTLRIRYFMYYLKSQSFKEQLTRYITGSAQLNYGPSHIKQMVMPWIPLESQDKLIERLDRVQVIIEHKEQQLTCLDKLVKSRFVEMFGDGCPKVTVETVCSTIVDCPHSTPKYDGDILCYPAIRTSEIRNGQIDWNSMKYVDVEEYKLRTKRLVPKAGDIVYAREGTYGDCVILPEGYSFCLGQRTMLFRPNITKCIPAYLHQVLRSDDVKRQADESNAGSTVPHVNIADAKNFIIPLPKMELQQQYATFVEQIDVSRTVVIKSVEQLEMLKESLMHQYFG